MKPTQMKEQPNKRTPYLKPDLWSRLTFSWIEPLLEKSYNEKLSVNDLGDIPADYKVKYNEKLLQDNWEYYKGQKNGMGLIKALGHTYKSDFCISIMYRFF
jgi:ABC-type multidrug transport system fused ATPase/permease subunit